MVWGLRRLPKWSSPTPNRRALGWRIPQKPTNSLEMGWESLRSGPNKGLHPSLGVLPSSQSMAVEGQP